MDAGGDAMNRRRFLGSIAAITAAFGVTRVPDSVQASEMPADFAAAQAHGRARIEDVQGYWRDWLDPVTGRAMATDPHAHCGPDCDQWRDLLQWDWNNPTVVTRSGSFVSGGVVNVVGYHEPVRQA